MFRSARCTPRTAAGSTSGALYQVDGEEVPYSDVAKGCGLPDGEIVVITDDELAHLPLPTARSIEVLNFSPADHRDFSSAHYIMGIRLAGC